MHGCNSTDKSGSGHTWRRLRVAAWMIAASARAASADVVWTVVDQHGEPLADAVITLSSSAPESDMPDIAAYYAVVQKSQTFQPQVLVVPTGSEVAFPNQDDVQHHVYSFSPAKVFQLKLYQGDAHAPVRFDTPGVVELGCNIHDKMRGFLYVTDADRFGITGADGMLTLSPAAAGAVSVTVWHPRQVTPHPEIEFDYTDEPATRTVALHTVPPPEPVVRGLKAWSRR